MRRVLPPAPVKTAFPASCPCAARRALRRAAVAVLLAAAGTCAAQGTFAVYAGARGGGTFDDADDRRRSYGLDGGAAFSASLDWPLADGRQGQVFASLQRSALPGEAFGRSGKVDVDVGYLHVGGRVFLDGTAASRAGYAVGGLGVTHFSPAAGGTAGAWRPSLNLGVGAQWPLAPQWMLRAELRGYVTLVDSAGGFLCAGGCVVRIAGRTMTQGEALVGLAFGF